MLHNNSLVYWSEWTPTYISIGVNEFIYFHMNTTHLPESINPVVAFSGLWPYRMILNTTVWPQEMIVDWVRVYQQKKLIIDK